MIFAWAVTLHAVGVTRISDRSTLLDTLRSILPTAPRCAEIGSWRGAFAQEIFDRLAPSTLHILDLWEDLDARYSRSNEGIVRARFAPQIASGRVFTIAGPSLKTIKRLPRKLDFMYLDTTHAYELTARELLLLDNHTRVGSFVCGHDYTHAYGSVYYPRDRHRNASTMTYGVMEAVAEFLLYHGNYELAYVTTEALRSTYRHGSFCMRRVL